MQQQQPDESSLGNNPLFNLVQSLIMENNHEQLKIILSQDETTSRSLLQVTNEHGHCLICTALIEGQDDLLDILLAYADIRNQANTKKVISPLFIAASLNKLSALRKLIHAGANINESITSNRGTNPLCEAAEFNLLAIATELLKQGANVNQARKEDHQSPLFIAAELGHREMAAVLIKFGANLNQPSNTRTLPSKIAMQKEHSAIVKLLIDAGAKFHLDYFSPATHEYLNKKNTQHIKLANKISFVLEKHADTPADTAKYLGKKIAYRLAPNAPLRQLFFTHTQPAKIFESISQIKYLDKEKKLVSSAAINQDIFWAIIKNLISAKTNSCISIQQLKAVYATLFAFPIVKNKIIYNRLSSLKDFLSHLDTDTKKFLFRATDQSGQSLSFIAVATGNIELIQLLIAHNINLEQLNAVDRTTPLHMAAIYGFYKILELIIPHSPHCINQVDHYGMTPLLLAVTGSHPKTAAKLLEHGAIIDESFFNSALQLTPLIQALEINRVFTQTGQLQFFFKSQVASATAQTKLMQALKEQNIFAAFKLDQENSFIARHQGSITHQENQRRYHYV